MLTNTTATMELVETGEKRDRAGRRITPAARREELVECGRAAGCLRRSSRVGRACGI